MLTHDDNAKPIDAGVRFNKSENSSLSLRGIKTKAKTVT